MRKVKLGIIGCGVIGPSHMAATTRADHIELVAVADRIPERAKTAAEKFNARKTYSEGADLIADPEIEAIVLAFPAAERCELALQAFGLGKHVLVEKPVASNAGEVETMLAAKGDCIAACCSSRYRCVEGAQIATEFIASGALGQLRVVRGRGLGGAGKAPQTPPPTWRLRKCENGGGILMNWGSYDLDYLLGITGWALQPQTVFAQTWTAAPQFELNIASNSDAETHGLAIVRCADNIALSFERGEYMSLEGHSAWEVIGTKGSLRLHMTAKNPKQIYHDDTTTADGVTTRILWEGDENTDMVHDGPVVDFCHAILENRQPLTSLEQALVVQKITDAIYKSADTGMQINI